MKRHFIIQPSGRKRDSQDGSAGPPCRPASLSTSLVAAREPFRDTMAARSPRSLFTPLPPLRSQTMISAARLVFVFFILVSLAGCSPKWRAKFIRKSAKSGAAAQPILVLQPDQKALMPAADRYRQHFAFWKSWHGSLLDSLGQLRKRDVVHLNGVIGELQSMQGILTGKAADHLREILMELRETQNRLNTAPSTWQIPAATRTRLQQLYREIDKKYHYSKVKDALLKE